MTTPYLSFVSALVAEGRAAMERARASAVTLDALRAGDARAAAVYEHLLSYLAAHAGAPDRFTVEGETGVDVGDPPAQSADYWIEKMVQFRLHGALDRRVARVRELLDAGAPDQALAEYEEGLRAVRREQLVATSVVPLGSLIEDTYAHYRAIKGGLRGIPFPWPTANEATLGMWPGDLIIFVARPAIGKSWCLVIMAMHAWGEGHKVLFLTTELTQRAISQRLLAYQFGTPHRDLYRGQMNIFAERRFEDAILSRPPRMDDFLIVGGEFDFRVASLEAVIQDTQPDLVMVDGAYLLRLPAKTRTEQAAEVFDELKRLAKRHHVPIVTTTQFNRQVALDKVSTVQLGAIGLTDAAGWNADLVWGMFQSDEMRSERRMFLKNLKGREIPVPDMTLHWDHRVMDFTEVPEPSDGDADNAAAAGVLASATPGSSGPAGDPNDPYNSGTDTEPTDPNDDLPF